MLPMLQREVVEKRGWITEEQILDCYAIGQCTPGVIAVNTATFVGFRQAGILGAAAATVGVVAPSLLIISALAGILRRIAHYDAVRHAFAGIRVAVSVLVGQAVVKLWRKGVKGAWAIAAWLAALVLAAFFGVSPVWLVAAAIAAGLVLAWREARK
jgi:chromate transporter